MRHSIRNIIFGLAIIAVSALPLTQFAGHVFGAAAGGTGDVVAAAHGELLHHGVPTGQAGHEAETHCGVSGCLVISGSTAYSPVKFHNVQYLNIVLAPFGVNAGHEPPPPRFG
ncbi:MAG: hypothetical protein HOJ06_17015 [Rhodospirillaceae bacterium]|jgi:hypothetical protein|nr:hypothetical protein [Rhodospirillaceae bacterium]MBT5810276.1 hypothetical protein [Rhodospirillaceae bacterium]